MDAITLYSTLVLSGFVLIGMEIFLPGGILGIIGALIWLAAATVGYLQFDTPWNTFSALSLLFLLIITFILWMRFFPKSKIGKSLTLNENLNDSQSHTNPTIEIGTTGKSISNLRPSGIALINGRRTDVLAEANWIEADKSIYVVSNQNATVKVREVTE